MDCEKDIEKILERYWSCATTLEEEEALRRFFRQRDVPPRLERYRPWFVEASLWKEVEPGGGFAQRVEEAAASRPVRALRVTFRQRMMPLLRAVAVVAVLLAAGVAAQYSLDGGGSPSGSGALAGSVPGDTQVVRREKPSALVNICEGSGQAQGQVRDSIPAVKGIAE